MKQKAAPATGSEDRAKRPFRIAGYEVARGRSMDFELPVARLPGGAWASMPLRVIHGATPGPTLWLSAAIHGDELNGIIIVRRLIDRIDPKALHGSILAVPIVNVFGVANGNRYLPDRRDLNRSFPGSAKGSLASRLANIFFNTVAVRCDLGIDYHTASNGRDNLPQIRCDLEHEETREYATEFGAPLVLHANLRDGSLRAAARKRDIHILLYEAGEANRLSQADIDEGVGGTLRVMRRLGMLNGPMPVAKHRPILAHKSFWVRASRSGFMMLRTELGETIRAGEVVATIDDGIGKHTARVTARAGGIVIGVQRAAAVHRGDALVHVAEVDS